MPDLPLLRTDYAGRHGACGSQRLHTVMDATTKAIDEAVQDLDTELELWDWARAAGVSADDLRQALVASMPTPELRKAA